MRQFRQFPYGIMEENEREREEGVFNDSPMAPRMRGRGKRGSSMRQFRQFPYGIMEENEREREEGVGGVHEAIPTVPCSMGVQRGVLCSMNTISFLLLFHLSAPCKR
uniref:Uncharacterized protein n=1 Tax=Nelumbo nucifera TaxID=4432 RepID=A0A822YIM6_NELNU|nr:TPA_asm: hypothetical protein HUJ06_011193 [Nelumbo nucifera]